MHKPLKNFRKCTFAFLISVALDILTQLLSNSAAKFFSQQLSTATSFFIRFSPELKAICRPTGAEDWRKGRKKFYVGHCYINYITNQKPYSL